MKLLIGRRFLVAFALAFALVIANAIISYRAINTLIEANGWVVHTQAVLVELKAAVSAIKDAETGQRDYLITGDEQSLQTSREAGVRAAENVRRVQELTTDNQLQRSRISALQQKIAARLETLQKVVDLRQRAGLDAVRQSGLLAQGEGEMNRIRESVAEMEAEENRLLEIRTEESRVSGRNTILTFLFANLLVLTLFALVYYLISRDLRERMRSENNLREANEHLEMRVEERTAELGKTNVELERSNRELQDFAFVASHDLQEPLRKIQAFGDRLRMKYGEPLGEEGRDHLARMQNAAKRMQTLINDLLTFSRVTTKAQPFAPVDLNEITDEVLEDLETRIQQTGGRVEVGELPVIEADPLQTRQLMQNLIGNALKFHRPDVPPVVKVTADSPENNNGNNGGQNEAANQFCQIKIEDNGIGFEEKYLDRIFTPFQRLHARGEYEGTGMGLAVCRKIVERHGGSVTAESTPGAGTTFIVRLPVKQNEGEKTI